MSRSIVFILAFTLASPVVVWGALPFHRAAWTNARHGATTMDTLVSVGVIAAYLVSRGIAKAGSGDAATGSDARCAIVFSEWWGLGGIGGARRQYRWFQASTTMTFSCASMWRRLSASSRNTSSR